MFFVYAIKSIDRDYIYVGLTGNLNRRFDQHQKGQNKTTAPYRPFTLIYQETFETRIEARAKEIYLKSVVGKEFLFLLQSHYAHPDLHSFPTRRSSDLSARMYRFDSDLGHQEPGF